MVVGVSLCLLILRLLRKAFLLLYASIVCFFMEGKKSSIKASKILKHLLRCLKEGKHAHVLKWTGQLEFEVILKDRRNPTWTKHDNSLLEELDELFNRNYKKGTTPRSRFNARMQSLCKERLKETTAESKSESTQKTIKRRTFKILSENCGAELDAEENNQISNSIDSLVNVQSARQSLTGAQTIDFDFSNTASHYSCLSKHQDYDNDTSTNEILSHKNKNHASIYSTSSSQKMEKEASPINGQIISNIIILPSNKEKETTSMIVQQNYSASNLSNTPSYTQEIHQNGEGFVASEEYFNNSFWKEREKNNISENENHYFPFLNSIIFPSEEKEEILKKASFLHPATTDYGSSLLAENFEIQHFEEYGRISLGSMVPSQESDSPASSIASSVQEINASPVVEDQIIPNGITLASPNARKTTSMIVQQNYTTSSINDIPSFTHQIQQSGNGLSEEYFNYFNHPSSSLSKEREKEITSENENDFIPFLNIPTKEKEELLEEATFLQPSPFSQSPEGCIPQAESFETQYFDQSDRISLGRMILSQEDNNFALNTLPSAQEIEAASVVEDQIIPNIIILPPTKEREATIMIEQQNSCTLNISGVPFHAQETQQNGEESAMSEEYFNNFNLITSENENDYFPFLNIPTEEEKVLEKATFLQPSPFSPCLDGFTPLAERENVETQYFDQNDRMCLESMELESFTGFDVLHDLFPDDDCCSSYYIYSQRRKKTKYSELFGGYTFQEQKKGVF